MNMGIGKLGGLTFSSKRRFYLDIICQKTKKYLLQDRHVCSVNNDNKVNKFSCIIICAPDEKDDLINFYKKFNRYNSRDSVYLDLSKWDSFGQCLERYHMIDGYIRHVSFDNDIDKNLHISVDYDRSFLLHGH